MLHRPTQVVLTVVAYVLTTFAVQGTSHFAINKAIGLSWLVGGLLASYIILGEAGKYAIPSVSGWIAVEASAAFVQFTLFGLWLGFIHRGGRTRLPAV